jgi:hypothetical protein
MPELPCPGYLSDYEREVFSTKPTDERHEAALDAAAYTYGRNLFLDRFQFTIEADDARKRAEGWLLISAAAEKMGLSKEGVRAMCVRGALPGVERNLGGWWWIPPAAVEAYLKAHPRKPSSVP